MGVILLAVAAAVFCGGAPAKAASGDVFVLTGRGWGHGVGMSQAGANVMARAGSDYREILTHYYTGVVIEPMAAGSR
jgi:SpoIID/LytB domain protein